MQVVIFPSCNIATLPHPRTYSSNQLYTKIGYNFIYIFFRIGYSNPWCIEIWQMYIIYNINIYSVNVYVYSHHILCTFSLDNHKVVNTHSGLFFAAASAAVSATAAVAVVRVPIDRQRTLVLRNIPANDVYFLAGLSVLLLLPLEMEKAAICSFVEQFDLILNGHSLCILFYIEHGAFPYVTVFDGVGLITSIYDNLESIAVRYRHSSNTYSILLCRLDLCGIIWAHDVYIA